MTQPRRLVVEARPVAGLWVATAASAKVTETGSSYQEAIAALKVTLEKVLGDEDVELRVTVYDIDD